jgi:hypothetical protein
MTPAVTQLMFVMWRTVPQIKLHLLQRFLL